MTKRAKKQAAAKAVPRKETPPEQKKEVEVVEAPPPKAILIELENVAVDGRHVLYTTLERTLAEKDVKLTPALFSRYCLDVPAKVMVPALLKATQKTRFSEEKMLAEVSDELRAAFVSSKIKPAGKFMKLASAAANAGIILGGLTFLDHATVELLTVTLGIPDIQSRILSIPEDRRPKSAGGFWLDAANAISVSHANCLAICTSAKTCASALDARMRCVAIPDRYTTFQPFSGADRIFDQLDDSAIDAIMKMLR